MIVKMTKYQFVLFSGECGAFVERLRGLGMVDITTSGWEPSVDDRALLQRIETLRRADDQLSEFRMTEAFDRYAVAYESAEETYAEYLRLSDISAEYDAEIERLQKIQEEVTPWGEFSSADIQRLEREGVTYNYFVASEAAFEQIEAERSADLVIHKVSQQEGQIYFVVVTREGEESDLNIDAQMLKPLTLSWSEAEAAIEQVDNLKESLNGSLSRVALSLPRLVESRTEAIAELQSRRVASSAEEAAEGQLLVLEGWAEAENTKAVDRMLGAQSALVYFKSDPTPEDNTPVKLKNNRYARLFEMVGNLYALPKYGTIDLTPFFAPFYMLFFAICLCDAGYGAIIFAAGLYLMRKGKKMEQAAWFTTVCGATAVAFGFLANAFFGMEISSLVPALASFPFINFQEDFFMASMAIGIVQILFGMVINIYVKTRSFGFRYALGNLGWFLIVASSVASAVLSNFGVTGFEFDSVAYYCVVGLGAALLLLLNTPGKNIFANIGSGIWATYDNITGLLGDVLSYVRLFAIGLSGGVLALVFNNLAMGMTGLDGSWDEIGIGSLIVKIICAALILILGHGISIFMSTISSVVHPMRLTFVEFYKNAGFEMGVRKFEPLDKEDK